MRLLAILWNIARNGTSLWWYAPNRARYFVTIAKSDTKDVRP